MILYGDVLLNVTLIVPHPGTSLSEARGLGITKVRTDERLATTSPVSGSAVNFAAESSRTAQPEGLGFQ